MKAILIKGTLCAWVEIENRLEALQYAVGGYIETVPLGNGGVMIVDEEGRLKGLARNTIASLVAGMDIVGKALIVGVDGEEFCDVPEYFHDVMQFPKLFNR